MSEKFDYRTIKKAKDFGISLEGKNQAEVIHAIQKAEGFTPCYGRGLFVCGNLDCCWRETCLGICSSIRRFEVIE